MSERRACKTLGQNRSAFRKKKPAFEEAELRAALRVVAATHPAWGWRKADEKRLSAEYSMHVLSFDFHSGVTTCGRHIRFLNVIDESTRTALAIIPRRSFKATDVIAVLEGIIAGTGIEPAYVRCDNGPEFTAAAVIDWCAVTGVKTAFMDPGSPWQNGFIESFNAQFRKGSSPEKSWT